MSSDLTEQPRTPPKITVVEKRRGFARLKLNDLWENQELLALFAWRDLKVRYKQTAIGATWAVLQPLLLMALFAVVFGVLLKIDVGDEPRTLFFYSALVPWTYFSNAVLSATSSIVSNRAVITKVYFPRIILPVASIMPQLVDLLISTVLLFIMGLLYGYRPTIGVVFLPLFIALAFFGALGIGLWLASLNARFRDVQHAITFIVQAWFFASPVFYPSSYVPRGWRFVLALNPMAGVIDGYRWAFLGQSPPGDWIYVSAGLVVIAVISGLWYFRHSESSLVDVV